MTPLLEKHFLRYHIPALVWAVLIFVASSIPNASLPPIGIQYEDKWTHLLIFAVFGFLIMRSFHHQTRITLRPGGLVLLAIVLGVIYGILDEFHQSFVPGRYPEVLDAVADALGVILGVFVFRRFFGRSST